MQEHIDRLNRMATSRDYSIRLDPTEVAAIRWAVSEITDLRRQLKTSAAIAVGVAAKVCDLEDSRARRDDPGKN